MTKKRIIIFGCCTIVLLFALLLMPLARDTRIEALSTACWRGDVGRVRLLLALGADPNQNCSSAFEFTYPIESAAWNNYPEVIHLLVKAGASVNVSNSEGGSPLCTAAREGATEAAKALLSYGARTTTENGTSVLTVARRFGHKEIARLIEASPLVQPNQ